MATGDGARAAREAGERVALDVLHDEVERPTDRRPRRGRTRRCGWRMRAARRPPRRDRWRTPALDLQVRVRELERDLGREAGRGDGAREVDRRHPAARDGQQDLVTPDAVGRPGPGNGVERCSHDRAWSGQFTTLAPPPRPETRRGDLAGHGDSRGHPRRRRQSRPFSRVILGCAGGRALALEGSHARQRRPTGSRPERRPA